MDSFVLKVLKRGSALILLGVGWVVKVDDSAGGSMDLSILETV